MAPCNQGHPVTARWDRASSWTRRAVACRPLGRAGSNPAAGTPQPTRPLGSPGPATGSHSAAGAYPRPAGNFLGYVGWAQPGTSGSAACRPRFSPQGFRADRVASGW